MRHVIVTGVPRADLALVDQLAALGVEWVSAADEARSNDVDVAP